MAVEWNATVADVREPNFADDSAVALSARSAGEGHLLPGARGLSGFPRNGGVDCRPGVVLPVQAQEENGSVIFAKKKNHIDQKFNFS